MPFDPINPAHYRSHSSGIECIKITRHMNFNLGNAIKYIWRAGNKGDPILDLKKAQWYINDEINRLQQMQEEPPNPAPSVVPTLSDTEPTRMANQEDFERNSS